LLAGLETGVVAALAMLGWLGLSAAWYRHSFWTAPNLLASTFYGEFALGNGFTERTFPGLALYVLLYGSLECCSARRSRPFRQPAPHLHRHSGGRRLVLPSLRLGLENLESTAGALHADRPMFAGHVLLASCWAGIREICARCCPGWKQSRSQPMRRCPPPTSGRNQAPGTTDKRPGLPVTADLPRSALSAGSTAGEFAVLEEHSGAPSPDHPNAARTERP